ncbi:TetR/AcrR family transcriptional regulator [Solicola gregarius]|uniref:TetR family transcriptional regulator n=1 Tax=Solicola gregarius TaxID=2908642 RepID=A0AA46YKQ1_9ACTN|nr:TetR family transcriptional regulator [Solicola gregarius]UYM04168.1 TetR family transcriptional regulator [Solicola gregarius]
MARPIATGDEQLLAAADRILLAQGPAAFTLAKAAAEAGVSAATLIKRFGSKEALFLRLSQRWVSSMDAQLTEVAAGRATPLERFRAVALHGYADLDHAATAAMQLATLAVDLQNDAQRALLDVGWSHVRRHLSVHAADAIEAGALAGCPPPEQLARLVFTAMEGGCLSWSVHPEGSLVARLEDDLDALLSGWTTAASETNEGKGTR